MTDDNPVDVNVAELLDADFAGEGTVRPVKDVLGCDADLRVRQAARECEVQGWGRNDDFGGWVELGVVEVLYDGGDGLCNTVPGCELTALFESAPLRAEVGGDGRGFIRGCEGWEWRTS